MTEQNRSPEQYRQLADKFRQNARTGTTEIQRADLLARAETWDLIADRFEPAAGLTSGNLSRRHPPKFLARNEGAKLKQPAKSTKSPPKRPRGRPRLGDKALSNAERQRRYRARKRQKTAVAAQ